MNGREDFLNRRQMLGRTAAAMTIATSSAFFEQNAVAASTDESKRKYKRLIYLWQDGGGPSGPDSFDPKDSPCVDSPFNSIPTSVPGVQFSECFPRLAEMADQMTLFRERHQKNMSHDDAIADSLGRDKLNERHMLMDVADRTDEAIFCYAQGNDVISAFDYRKVSFSVHLAAEAKWNVQEERYSLPPIAQVDPRINDRWNLRKELTGRSPIESSITGSAANNSEEQIARAVELVRKAEETSFSLDADDILRYTNGEKPNPSNVGPLFARELINKNIAGAVLLRMGHIDGTGIKTGWDHHANLPDLMRTMSPGTDHAIAQLIKDLKDGVLTDTVIVYDTEFGRTPKMNSDNGRDHFSWHPSFIVGEEYAKGSVIGATDKRGAGVDGETGRNAVNNELFRKIVLEGVKPEKDFGFRVNSPKGVFH
jgi:hypothetical protein